MSKTKIEWTRDDEGNAGETWNPVLGCSKISPGCTHCYAINNVHRMAGNPNPKIMAANEGLTVIEGGHPNWSGKVRLIPERLEIPLRKRKPTTYFVNSLSDLFHEGLTGTDIDRVLAVMGLTPRHTFQVLTKRAERMCEVLSAPDRHMGVYRLVMGTHILRQMKGRVGEFPWPLPNVWLGVSVESRDYLSRIDDLRRTPAAVRFLSLEPLLEDLGQLDLSGIHWVIVGGESGRGARPMPPEWARSIRDQCLAAGVPFFFKQAGEFSWIPGSMGDCKKYIDVPVGDGTHHRMFKVGKKKAGRLLDGRTWDEMPETAATTRSGDGSL